MDLTVKLLAVLTGMIFQEGDPAKLILVQRENIAKQLLGGRKLNLWHVAGSLRSLRTKKKAHFSRTKLVVQGRVVFFQNYQKTCICCKWLLKWCENFQSWLVSERRVYESETIKVTTDCNRDYSNIYMLWDLVAVSSPFLKELLPGQKNKPCRTCT